MPAIAAQVFELCVVLLLTALGLFWSYPLIQASF